MPESTPANSSPRWRNTLLAACPGLLLAALCLLPYLNKAFTIDDPWFLLEARQILKTPLDPLNFDICWQGNETCGLAAELAPNAALMGYALIPAILMKDSERVAHAEQLLFCWIAILAMAAVAIRLGWDRRHAMFAGLLLVAIPPFLPMASTAMPDSLGLALTLVGVERLLAWKAEGRWWQAVMAGLALGLAPYARPHLLLFLGLGAFLLLDDWRISTLPAQLKKLWRWTPIAIAALVFAALTMLTYHAGSGLSSAGSDSGTVVHVRNAVSYMLYLAFPIPLAIPWLLAHGRRWPFLLNAAPFVLVLATKMVPGSERIPVWILAAFFAGLVALFHFLFDAWRSREPGRMVLALWLLIPLPVAIYGQLPIKILLPLTPAVVLILLQLSGGLPKRTAAICGSLMVAGGTAYSALILHADDRFAESSRRAVQELVVPHIAAGERVWMAGQWGFYWYGLEAGAQLARPISGPYPGDLLAIPTGLEGSAITLNRVPRRTLLKEFVESCSCGRTMSSGAGLYTNGLGNALWVWGRGEVARFELWRID